MKLILILMMLLGVSLMGSSVNTVVYNETIFNNDRYEIADYKGTVGNTENIFHNKLKLKLYGDITEDLSYTTMGVYSYNNISEGYSSGVMQNSTYKNSEVYFDSIYLTYRLSSSYYLVGGLVAFSEGSYNELSELDYVKGAGLSKIINVSIEALFLVHKGKVFDYTTITKLGYGVLDGSNLNKGSKIQEDNSGSEGYYLTYSMYKDFDSIKFNYFEGNIHKDGVDVAHTKILGLGFNKYFLESGINIFSTVGYCKNDIYSTTNTISPFVLAVFPNAFDFNGGVSTGSLYSLGISKDIDSNLVESYNIGIDYTHTSDNWYSLVNNDYSDIYNSRFSNGDNTVVWLTTKFTTDIALKIYYVNVRGSTARAIGNPTKSIPYEDSLTSYVKSIDRTGFKLIIKY